MPKSRTPRVLDPEMRRRVIAFARDMYRWLAEIDQEAHWLARLDGREHIVPDDDTRAIRRLCARGVMIPWSDEWNGEKPGPHPPSPRLPPRHVVASGRAAARRLGMLTLGPRDPESDEGGVPPPLGGPVQAE